MDLLKKSGQDSIANSTVNTQRKGSGQFNKEGAELVKPLSENILSMIFADQQKQHDPQFLRVKNNLLILLLILTAYGIYSLFSEFMDTIVLAFITGIAYQQSRNKFIDFCFSRPKQQKSNILSILKKVSFFVLIVLGLPWLHTISGEPSIKMKKAFNLIFFLECQFLYQCLMVRIIQISFLIYIFAKLAGPTIANKIALTRSPLKESVLKGIFALAIGGICLIGVVMVPTLILNQTKQIGLTITHKAEVFFNCEILGDVNAEIPSCADKLFGEGSSFKPFMENMRAPTETGVLCLNYLIEKQVEYFGTPVFGYQQEVCAWVSLIERVSPHVLSKETSLLTTGRSIFTALLFNSFEVLKFMSNGTFAITTFFAIFVLTVEMFNPKDNELLEVLHGEKRQLIQQIATLIQGTFTLVLEHFALSIFLLQVFSLTSTNLLISACLSFVAFVPVFKPPLFAWFLVGGKLMMGGNVGLCIVFGVAYTLASSRIYQASLYDKLQLHQIIASMSVLFGIYQFGVSGIFYGPIIIILFKYVHIELFKKRN